jgi:nicotinate-nucleotide--dimethylbenzimidazole phosphoribosyltransferase
MTDVPSRFDDDARAAVYQAIALRRDIRAFRPGEVDAATLDRLLDAAMRAPSVGYSQPWGFVVVRDPTRRARIRESFLRCREVEAARFSGERRERYLEYKLEGIVESTLNLCVVADLRDPDAAVLGTTAQPESLRASVACAVQNLWLAARVEGLGVGWVSIVEPAVLRDELALPAGVEPIAYLCIGHPTEFRARPLLEETGWATKRASAIFEERWSAQSPPARETGSPTSEPVSTALRAHARASTARRLAVLAKPRGGLGRLEELAERLAAATGRAGEVPRAALSIFAADHGVSAEGVSAYPSTMTAGALMNAMAGGAAATVMAARLGIEVELIDVGVAGDLRGAPTAPRVPLLRRCVRAGTANFVHAPAMTPVELERAMAVGAERARAALAAGKRLLAAGEIGIGNTTSAAALVAALTGAPASEVVGSGTGVDAVGRARKVAVVEAALARQASASRDPFDTLAALGGLELAAMCGFYLAAAEGALAVVDGFPATAAALVAKAITPAVVDSLVASHASAEAGARRASEALGLTPLLDLGLRVGEGTGALLAMDLILTAATLEANMATFETSGIVDRIPATEPR